MIEIDLSPERTSEQITLDVLSIADRALAGELDWVDVAESFWYSGIYDDPRETNEVDQLVWSFIGGMFDRDCVVNPQNINYPYCGGEWTADADRQVMQDIREMRELIAA